MTSERKGAEDAPSPPFGMVALVIGALSAALTLSVGVANGDSTHPQYLLEGLRRADPAFLAGDWFTHHTRPVHWVFNWVVAAAERVSALEAVLTLGSFATALVFVSAVYGIAASLYARPLLPTAVAVALFVAALGETRLIGEYIFRVGFQPSMASAAAMVGGLAFLGHRRRLAAGIALGAAALLHEHIAVLLVGVLGGTTLWHLRSWPRRAFGQLWIPFLLLGLPSFVEVASVGTTPGVEQAIAVYMDRFAHHYQPRHWPVAEFADFGSLILLGVGGILLRAPNWRSEVLPPIGVTALVVAIAIPLGWLELIEIVNRLWPWRLASLLTILGLITFAAALSDRSAWQGDGTSRTRALAVGIVFVAYAIIVRDLAAKYWIGWMAACSVPAIVWAVDTARRRDVRWARAAALAPYAMVAAGLLPAIASGIQRSHLDIRRTAPDRQALYDWVRSHTTPQSLVLMPPVWSDFRLKTERPVVVDWISVPFVPSEILEWHRRLQHVTGGRDFITGARNPDDSLDAIRQAYRQLSCRDVAGLRERYGITHWVVHATAPVPCGAAVYRDERYVVLDLSAVETSEGDGPPAG